MQGWSGIATFLVASALAHGPSRVAAEATKVEVSRRQLLVDGLPFHMKGVCWNPVPSGGTHPADLDFAGFAATDAELMASAGINVVRTYEAINDTRVLDALWQHKIYVLDTVYISGVSPVESALSSVEMVKDHPAIMMWVVGNEWNYNGLYTGLPFEESQERVRDVVQRIKDADPKHPVATVYGELPSSETLEALDNVDAWGINKYDGDSFGNLFDSWAELSDLPMFLGEYGADAYNMNEDKEDERAQSDATVKLTTEIVEASSVDKDGVCIGGIIFELADEYWKDDTGNPGKQDIGGVSPGGGPYPDRTFNEEWWGLVHHDGTPREAFKAYAAIKVPGGAALDPARLAGVLDASPPPREKACGAHRACRGLFGNCCPADNGSRAACCDATSTQPPEEQDHSSTTWRPPKPKEDKGGKPKGDSALAYEYPEQQGQFANGHFAPDLPGCMGIGECQFKTRQEAERWCDDEPTCTMVLLHPFDDNCAGGFGCYTPRYGRVSVNSLFERSGGKSFQKGDAKRAGAAPPQDTHKDPVYTFVGYREAGQTQEACEELHGGRPAMPKTDKQREALLQAMDAAQAAGKMSKTWPKNTIWLGGRWSEAKGDWEWLDGSTIDRPVWASGQPSSAKAQDQEPWLCMMDTTGGGMHDSETGVPPFEFGVVCESAPADDSSGEPGLSRPLMGSAAEALDDAEAEEVEEQSDDGLALDAPKGLGRGKETAVETKRPAQRVRYGDYEFVGFHGPEGARQECGDKHLVATLKTEEQKDALLAAVDSAMKDGLLGRKWPNNTIWLGGRWDSAGEEWRWDDGARLVDSEVPWAEGQPSARRHQGDEPWMCLVRESGEQRPVVHDSESGPPYSFGVMCQEAQATKDAPEPASEETPAPASASEDGADDSADYRFIGWETPSEARDACHKVGRLAMPKTDGQKKAVLQAIKLAISAGDMEESWPRNAVWLAGRWNASLGKWEWDDSSDIPQLAGNKAAKLDSASKPWLCVSADGQARAWDGGKLGVICRLGGEGQPLARELALSRPQGGVAWVRAPSATNCDKACGTRGLSCAEERWPRSRDEFERVVLQGVGPPPCDTVQSGGHRYDPSASGRHCGWRGPDDQPAWLGRRCGAPAPCGSERFCPCEGAPAAAEPLAELPIFS